MAPDLVLSVFVDGLSRERAEAISRATSVAGAIPLHFLGRRGLFGRGSVELATMDVHYLLTDDADWNAPTWAMDPAGLPRLLRTFEIVFAHVPEPLTIEALWGNPVVDEHWLSRDAFLELVRRGEIGTHTRYRVAPAA